MQGYIVQVGDDFVNWQGLLAAKEYAIILSQSDAETVAQIHTGAQVIPYERAATNNDTQKPGSYYEYHSAII